MENADPELPPELTLLQELRKTAALPRARVARRRSGLFIKFPSFRLAGLFTILLRVQLRNSVSAETIQSIRPADQRIPRVRRSRNSLFSKVSLVFPFAEVRGRPLEFSRCFANKECFVRCEGQFEVGAEVVLQPFNRRAFRPVLRRGEFTEPGAGGGDDQFSAGGDQFG